MKIRSITAFYNPLTGALAELVELADYMTSLRGSLGQAGIETQTLRLATQSFSKIIAEKGKYGFLNWLSPFEHLAQAHGFDYVSIGPALIGDSESYTLIPEILSQTRNVFTSALIADEGNGIDFAAIRACAEVIVQCAAVEENGFANLRFSALANVKAQGPFFPGSFHDETQPCGFSIAIEAADGVVNAFTGAKSLMQARETLLSTLEGYAHKIEGVITKVPPPQPYRFYGFDFSVAPFPRDTHSLGNALEILGVPQLGYHGSLAAAAFLADTLDRGRWKRAGFNGLMLPLLEDSRLAQRSIDQTLSIKDLLMYSAVCGTGLDTIPIAGDTPAEAIQALLLDIAALSSRLGKPLTARLMPIPGKKAGQLTNFDFEFFQNGRIFLVEADSLGNLLAKADEWMVLNKRVNRA